MFDKIEEIRRVASFVQFNLNALAEDMAHMDDTSVMVLNRIISEQGKSEVLFSEERYFPAALLLADCLLTMLCLGWIDFPLYTTKRKNLLFFPRK